MKYKTFSREEISDFLTDGIPMPESAIIDDNTIDFYFEELESFINLADNEFEAKKTADLEITILIDDLEFIILRHVDKKVFIFLANTRPDMIDTMTSDEASDIVGIVYGVTIYNQKWDKVNELVEDFIQDFADNIEYNATKEKLKMDPKVLEKLNKSPIQYPEKTMKIKDFEKYFKKDKDKKYG